VSAPVHQMKQKMEAKPADKKSQKNHRNQENAPN
jgi:hypothetical protein